MHASHNYTGSGSKVTKIAIVTALHVAVALALISMKVHAPAGKNEVIEIVNLDEPRIVAPKIEEPDLNSKKVVPDVVIPPILPIEVTRTTEPPPIAKVVEYTGKTEEPRPGTADGTGTNVDPVVPPKADRVFSAALANASDCVRPDYPARSVRDAETGTVTLALLIGANGKVSEARVQRSSGFKELDRAAVSALSMCKFKPATTNGIAEPAWGQIAYVWSLD